MPELPNQHLPVQNQPSGPQLSQENRGINWAVVTIVSSVIIFALIIAIFAYWFFVLRPQVESQPPLPAPTTKEATPSAEKDETADWNTYQSSAMKFSLKYPTDWSVSKEKLTSTGTEIEFTKSSDIRVFIRVGVRYSQELGREYTLEEWVAQEKKLVKENITEEVKEDDITLDNISATKLSYKNTQVNLITYEIFAQKEDKLYELITTINPTKKDIYNPVFEQILSTFKFLD